MRGGQRLTLNTPSRVPPSSTMHCSLQVVCPPSTRSQQNIHACSARNGCSTHTHGASLHRHRWCYGWRRWWDGEEEGEEEEEEEEERRRRA